MARDLNGWRWTFERYYKRWEGTHPAGLGTYAVSKLRVGGWYLSKVPWIGSPEGIAAFPSKEAAQQWVADKIRPSR